MARKGGFVLTLGRARCQSRHHTLNGGWQIERGDAAFRDAVSVPGSWGGIQPEKRQVAITPQACIHRRQRRQRRQRAQQHGRIAAAPPPPLRRGGHVHLLPPPHVSAAAAGRRAPFRGCRPLGCARPRSQAAQGERSGNCLSRWTSPDARPRRRSANRAPRRCRSRGRASRATLSAVRRCTRVRAGRPTTASRPTLQTARGASLVSCCISRTDRSRRAGNRRHLLLRVRRLRVPRFV